MEYVSINAINKAHLQVRVKKLFMIPVSSM